MNTSTDISENIQNISARSHSSPEDQAERLAGEIMELARSMLLVRMRFLEPAIMALGLEADPEAEYATDGWSIKYGFTHVLRSYGIQRELVMHDYLHMVLHLLFHHPFVGDNIDPYRWDLACDLAVETVIDELDLRETECLRSDQCRRLTAEFRELVPAMTAERIYHYLGEHPLEDTHLASLRDLVQSDSHSLWYQLARKNTPEDSVSEDDSDANGDEPGSGKSGGHDGQNDSGSDAQGSGSEEDSAEAERLQSAPDRSDAKRQDRQWKDISSRILTDLETESRRWADKSGSLERNIRERSSDHQDYREFLEQFMSLGEVMKVNNDEFDYIYYTYGLELYDNVPLVEPLEYADERRIRELAIVIDTSASVGGNLIDSFVASTLGILGDTDSYFSRTSLHVILCDASVQGDYVVRDEEDMSELRQALDIRGYGGTDFRPAFRYIDELIEDGDLSELKGVLYFTDGYGPFPEWRPEYETAFVFIEDPASSDDPHSVWIPPWAMRFVLEKNNSNNNFAY